MYTNDLKIYIMKGQTGRRYILNNLNTKYAISH
jgi:hypothetical protein